ncbi:MAG: hypothetical protein QF890_00715 [Myxococcota bacterium]|jgi:hypothetical protein|nr:hypothetical protein [Deltaproteobacteria bacterium]MCP4245258.1 cytochrome c [bacterium]MDP6073980.1 hypothetical protein [Myxococcota bacterium]MDP6241835.1 hypothetical protein [Myxococcota bacterium]MDP7074548.1 hypothetical protein [Myxococcota bacterium]
MRRSRPGLGLALALTLASAAEARDPAVDYMLECQGCHLPDGSGATDVPDLRDGIGRFVRVDGGRAYLVQVPGSSQAGLDDDALAAVLNWMIRSFGPAEVAASFPPFSADEVSRFRTGPLVEVEAVRRELVQRMGAD